MSNPNLESIIESVPDCDVYSPKPSNMIRDNQYKSSSSSSSPPQTPNAFNKNDTQRIANLISRSLKINILSSTREFVDNSSCEDDPKTPTSMEHKIPVLETCPRAPRKASWHSRTVKRKATYYKVYWDEMVGLNEVVYVPDNEVGDLGAGSHAIAKRLKPLPSPAVD